jgi:hypothetical protein
MGSVVLLYVKFEWTSTTEVFLTVLWCGELVGTGCVVCDVVVALLFNSFPGLESCSFEAVFVAVLSHPPSPGAFGCRVWLFLGCRSDIYYMNVGFRSMLVMYWFTCVLGILTCM